jgi:hypothetical protein
MEKFMLIFRNNASTFQTSSPEALQADLGRWMTWMNTLAESGRMTGGEQLMLDGRVITGAKQIITDGPFTEAKEIFGGYVIINAESLDEAVEIAKGCPDVNAGALGEGSVEIRQVAVENF